MDSRSNVDDSPVVEHAPASAPRTRLWLAGCVALVALVGAHWARLPAGERLRPPTSPLDRVAGLNETTRLGWGFLWQARDVLPPGATYTIVAGDPQIEMSIYMMSRAVLTECHAKPTSYYGRSSAEHGAEARYVLVYRCATVPAGATMVQQLADGCIWDRGAR